MWNDFLKKIRLYAEILTILGGIIIITKSYYSLTLNAENTTNQIKRLSMSIDKLDSNLDKLTIEVGILKNITKNK
jgi:hypothetical protein